MAIDVRTYEERVFSSLQQVLEPMMQQLIPQCKLEAVSSRIDNQTLHMDKLVELRITLRVPCKY